MKDKKTYLLIMITFTSFIILSSINSPINPLVEPFKENYNIKSKDSQSYSQQWIQNPTLTSPIEVADPYTWYSTSDGDLSDIISLDGGNQANITVIGNSTTWSFVADPPSSGDWINVTDPYFQSTPNQGNGIDSGGMWASHRWDEDETQLGQVTSIRWKRNVTTPVNMSDYEITSASLTTVVNATVLQDVDHPDDAPAHGGSSGSWQAEHGDYVRFYMLISDLGGIKEFEVAYNKTSQLGYGTSTTSNYYMYDTYLLTVPEEVLIFYLTSVLENDYQNFTITLGIFIFCEDNSDQYDLDTYSSLRIKSLNLTISFKKKIQRGTYATWNQKGNQLPTGNVVVDSASLHFKYKCEQNWSALDSPNSEIRMQINNITHTETVKLDTANSSFQEGKIGGFDVTNIIPKNNNITTSLQIYIADNFNLANNMTISIDDVYLWINYTIFLPTPPQPPYLNAVANTTRLYTNYWTQITITCENQTAESVSVIWYNDPFDGVNKTIDHDFTGLRTYYYNFTTDIAGPQTFKFWANSTLGLESYKEIIVLWVAPDPPFLNIVANTTNLYTNQWTQLTITCQNGTGTVSRLWYTNPFNGINYTIDTDFTGIQIYYLDFTNDTAGPRVFKFWANSTFELVVYDDITIVWEPPQSPILSVSANATTPYITQWTNITVSCQSGSANVDTLWYYNPIDLQNHTLGTNFAGTQISFIINTTGIAGSYKYEFWANSSLGSPAYQTITIVWITPQSPILSVSANATTPYITQWTNITVSCQSGSANV
ncbi:MAG: hypothetical protein ACFFD2_26485, partial [Promethearchaeota archaeon]